jgi:hypothetical protein
MFIHSCMNEKLLQFIWQFQYFNKANLRTTCDEEIGILHAGMHNTNQGPDFSDARLLIGTTTWAGNIEVHLKSSDWIKHNHQLDLHYDNVILHVVYEDDQKGPNSMPVLELKNRISNVLLKKYELLMNSSSFIPCEKIIHDIKPITLQNWKERLLAERLLRKAGVAGNLLKQTHQHWEELFWWMLARNFGILLNADAFGLMARSLPVNLLAKHKSNHIQLEALLMGQAGLLKADFQEEYPKLLQKEYLFLKKKYKLTEITTPLNYLRTRPGNFPSIRLAQLAMLIHQSVHLFSKIKEAEELREVMDWFKGAASAYWNDHYILDEVSVFKIKKTGSLFIENIIINTVVPVMFAYGEFHDNNHFKEKAIKWLEQLAAEKNNITKGFVSLGLKCKAAFDSQAFLELKNEYCDNKKCLQCAIGNALLKKV